MEKPIYHIRVTLCRTKPPIWRQLAVPSDITLGQLHEVIQIAMGWDDYHLHQFTLKDKSLKQNLAVISRLLLGKRWDELLAASRGIRVFVPHSAPDGTELDLEGEDENAHTLAEVCPSVKCKLIYEYDFGDGWEHTIKVEKILEPDAGVQYPVCLAGRRACPPEDCGGVWGYYEMLEAIQDPSHEMYEEYAGWLDADFDPEAFDVNKVNRALARWRSTQPRRRSRRKKRGGA